MKQISILGCGWLGLPLAKTLLEKGFTVKGSTTSDEKLVVLKNTGIIPFKIALTSDKIEGHFTDFLNESEILIIDIPPKLRNPDSESFVAKIENIIPFVEKSLVKKVIFISSTSVYGEENYIITEETLPNPETKSGKQLVESELLLSLNPFFTTTIIRFGGLIGEDRHPINSLSKKKNIENPDAPINLIHQDDCIGIILKIIQKNIFGETFNAVTPFHPSRKEYYTQKANEMNLPMPEFIHANSAIRKTILSIKMDEILNYRYRFPML